MQNPTAAQRELLTRAANEPEGAMDAPEDAKVAKALIKKGLAISLPVVGGASRLLITEAGRAAIADPDQSPPDAGAGATEGTTDKTPTVDVSVAQEGAPEATAMPEPADQALRADAQQPTPPAPPPVRKPKKDAPGGKLGALLGLLQRPEGATLAAMMEATGWQAHSVRGAMSGSLKKGFGFAISSEKTDVGRIYKITTGEKA